MIARLCAMSGGGWSTEEILAMTAALLGSEHAVRLTPDPQVRRRPPEWSTAIHRALEDDTLEVLRLMIGRQVEGVDRSHVNDALAGSPELGDDQAGAVGIVCGAGGTVRAILSPAGFGKTAMVHTAAEAFAAAGRPTRGVATTAKATAGMSGAGIEAVTIAQLRLDLADQPLPYGCVVIWDEVSQSSTRDANTVLHAVAGCPGGVLVVLGDPRQSPSVKAGGLAAEIAQLCEQGVIPAAKLTVNRRQVDHADQAALAALRAGRPVDSQTLRGEHRWEHTHATPTQAREALADAVVEDITAVGVDRVAVLAVSHVDAEDLADRIRHRLVATGVISGTGLSGPGWAADRLYQTGDRVLLHTRCGRRGSPLFNGTTATVTRVNAGGLDLRLEDGSTARLPSDFVTGTKADGSPKLSHAWARTIDGAQGGTWEIGHLLGTAALDALRGYTGQSRSRQPTHTWNTAIPVTVDHGGALADQRDPAEQVAAALARRPDTSLAARSDPWTLDRQLRQQIANHQAILAAEPLDRSAALHQAERQIADTERTASRARAEVRAIRSRIDQQSALAGLSPRGRRQREGLRRQLDAATGSVADADAAVARAGEQHAALLAEQRVHDRFVADNLWRPVEINHLQDQLDEHWAGVVLDCARAGDPLAFGIDRLRHARRSLNANLRGLEAQIPIDRDRELNQARQERADATGRVNKVRQAVATAKEAVAALSRWARRDAVTAAGRGLVGAEADLGQAVTAKREAEERLARVLERQQDRQEALRATEPRRSELARAIDELDAALDVIIPTQAELAPAAAGGPGVDRHQERHRGTPPVEIEIGL